nr:hypothetical protein [Tanacetum cinerariifolium]
LLNDVLPPSNDDSDDEVDVVGSLRVDNVIQDSKHEYSESEDFNLDNPLLSLPPPEPLDKEFDFEKEISVMRNLIRVRTRSLILDYPPKIEDLLCRILSWFSRPSIIPQWLKTSCVGYCPGFQDL